MSKTSFFFAACLLLPILIALSVRSSSTIPVSAATNIFSFVSMGDGQGLATNFTKTVNQIAALFPDLVIFNGDLEIDGVRTTELNPMVTALKNAGLFNQTFLVRGNHDNHVTDSATLWENYFESSPNIKIPPVGVTDYASLDSGSEYLNYSFNFGNAMFIGLDYPANIVDYLTSSQLSFLDARLTAGESMGLDHAFIYFHKSLYCVASTHCNCNLKTDASCTQSALVTVLNKHPIVSATFHGHEHILGWVHMSSARLGTLTDSFEEFFTSPSGGITDNAYLYNNRIDYVYQNMGESQGFAVISVNGASFTFSIYKVGTTAPVWSKTFTHDYHPKPTATYTFTPSDTLTATFTPTDTQTATFTPSDTLTATFTPTDTETATFTPSDTSTATHTPSPTNTDTPTSMTTETNTFTPTPTHSPTTSLYTLYLPVVLY